MTVMKQSFPSCNHPGQPRPPNHNSIEFTPEPYSQQTVGISNANRDWLAVFWNTPVHGQYAFNTHLELHYSKAM